jgi:hypothetical protein
VRSGWTSILHLLNVGGVEVTTLSNQLFNLGPVLLVLDLLDRELTLDA